MKITADEVTASLERVIDPELGVSVVDLGLIYNVQIDGNTIRVDMTLTNPGCPMAGMLVESVEQALREAFASAEVEVNLVWDPPWSPERLSEGARAQLDLGR